jgi:signal transduction histidine kinase
LPEVNKLAVNEREWFANLDADVFIPIHSKLEWIGMFALGHKTSGNRYYEDDLNLLCTLADQTAVALENARLFSDLMHLNRDLKQTHAALEDANQQLREIDGLKSAFIGKVTHELRTPFANIGFSLQVLERFGVEHLLPEQREQLKQLNNGVKLARKMVDNLITFASFINRQVGLNLEKVNFGQLMTETLVPLKDQAKTKGVEFYVEVVGELLPVLGDRKLISEAVYQLAHNAVKFTRAGGEVRVSCWIASGLLFFDIKDTGIGIPSDRLDGIWQGFDQEADSVRRGLEGLGLGLALVKFIVNAHGGEVWVESQLRVGSDFGFKIPLAGPPQ